MLSGSVALETLRFPSYVCDLWLPLMLGVLNKTRFIVTGHRLIPADELRQLAFLATPTRKRVAVNT